MSFAAGYLRLAVILYRWKVSKMVFAANFKYQIDFYNIYAEAILVPWSSAVSRLSTANST